MIGTDFDYLRPASVSEALEMASRHEDARFLAGGHALCRNGNSGARVRPS
jgi:CO/xanthine dehydrogenase FAD-binding subunit